MGIGCNRCRSFSLLCLRTGLFFLLFILHPHLLVLSCSLLSEVHPRQVLLKEGHAPQKTPQGANSFGIFFMFYCSILHIAFSEIQRISVCLFRCRTRSSAAAIGRLLERHVGPSVFPRIRAETRCAAFRRF